MEDVLYIHHLHSVKIDIRLLVGVSAYALDLFRKHRKVEFRRVETCKVTSVEPLDHFLCDLVECRAVFQILCRNTMYSLSRRIDLPLALLLVVPWLYSPCFHSFFSVRHYLDEAKLNDRVRSNVQSRTLNIKKDQRSLQIQFHFINKVSPLQGRGFRGGMENSVNC